MPRILIEISDVMYAELEAAVADEFGLSPHGWAAEAVEAALASRRLPHVVLSTKPARMIGPMKAAEIPRADELDCLADIT